MSRPNPVSSTLTRRGFGTLLGGAALLAGTRTASAAATVEKTVKATVPGLYEVVVSTSSNLVHVASTGARGANNAAVLGLDLRTLEQRSAIPLGADGVFGLAVNDRTGTLYGTATRAGQLLAVDIKSGTVKARIAQGENAHLRQPVTDEERNRVFVSVFGVRDKPGAVWVVDGAAAKVVNVIEGLDGGVAGLVYDPTHNRLFGTALQPNQVIEISLERGAAVRRFACGGEAPINLAFDGKSGRLYCANEKSGTVTAIDTVSGNVTATLNTGAGALGVTLTADGRTLLVANRGAGTVSVVDTASMQVTASLATGTHPNTVAVDDRSGLAYVSNKAKMGERGQPGQAPQPPPEDPNGDTVSLLKL